VEVVAEGVETKEQATFVKNLNCDVIQGYYFDKPMPASEFIKRLKKRVYD
jgi:EAL domain-containing protein (putative c-di-GMP-specific phosphodiesterase class I)